MVLGKLPVPGRPTNLDYSRARAYCACSRCGLGGLDIFSLVYHFSVLSPSLWETARYRLKYCHKGPLSPKNQPTNVFCQNNPKFVSSIFNVIPPVAYIQFGQSMRMTRVVISLFWKLIKKSDSSG